MPEITHDTKEAVHFPVLGWVSRTDNDPKMAAYIIDTEEKNMYRINDDLRGPPAISAATLAQGQLKLYSRPETADFHRGIAEAILHLGGVTPAEMVANALRLVLRKWGEEAQPPGALYAVTPKGEMFSVLYNDGTMGWKSDVKYVMEYNDWTMPQKSLDALVAQMVKPLAENQPIVQPAPAPAVDVDF